MGKDGFIADVSLSPTVALRLFVRSCSLLHGNDFQ